MAKGLADIETKRLIASVVEEGTPQVPEIFWCHNSLSKEESCCFWHYIFYPNGGPERDGVYHPLYKYEVDLLKTLDKKRTVAVYKSAGLGITEFMLLWILWKCYTDDFFRTKESIIITGPNVDLAQDLIKRTKDFLRRKDLDFIDGGAYELTVNTGTIKCYPSNNIHSARGKPKVACFFGDETAFFKLRDDSIVRTVGERYIGKNNAYVVWVSTAGEEPQGFFYDILQEKDSIYTKLHFYYDVGLKKDKKTGTSIYSRKFIKEAQKARSFEREFMGIWGKNVGDIFDPQAIEEVCKDVYEINPNNDSFDRVLGIDPGFGSSEFGIVAMQIQEKKKTVIFADSFERQSTSSMLRKIDDICKRFRIKKIFCDAANPEIIKDLRDNFRYNVTGLAFGQYGPKMTHYAADNVNMVQVRIHPMFTKLKHQLMTIKTKKDKEIPDKTNQNPFDVGDAFFLALYYYKMGSGVIVSAYG